ncbi:hypothetical protein [Streptomyces sp. NPDC002490]|uniref:hypothetical protein n=1 Tax=Streptomyces sp. NPDC002490 TaxID=3154416 RepID=UPI0033236A80
MRKRFLRPDGRRPAVPRTLVAASAAVAAGLLAGHLLDPRALTATPWYPVLAGLLLAVGLYGSTHAIDLREVRRDLRALLLTVTLGVLLKAALIAGVMVALFREPEYLVLGIAVAQIDPLSVAAMTRSSRMSPRAKNLLSVWASFDDPVTVLLTLTTTVVAFRLAGREGAPAAATGEGLAAHALTLGGNLLLFAVAAGLWQLLHRGARARPERPARPGRTDALALLLVVLVVAVAAPYMLMLAVAGLGLVVRTGRYAALVDRAVTVAFVLAALVLGLLLADGIALGPGLVLGLAAFGAQAVIGLLIAPLLFPGLGRDDRVHLGIGQQNGITAVILALALEPDFPGTVAIVGPAVLVVNTLHYTAGGLWHALGARTPRPPVDDPSPQHQRTPRSAPGDQPLQHPGATAPPARTPEHAAPAEPPVRHDPARPAGDTARP